MAKKLALLGASLLLGLAVVELLLRLIHYAPEELHLFRENPHGTGSYRLRPDLDLVARFDTREIPIKTNSRGMRWAEVSPAAPSRKKRVAFVGDSSTFGLWANSVQDSFVGVFETELAATPVEALNFGVPGYGLGDVELLIKEEVLPLQPACVVLMFYNGNDFLDTFLGLERYRVTRTGVLALNRDILNQKIPAEYRRRGFKFQRALAEHVYVVRLLKVGLKRLLRLDPAAARAARSVDRSYSSDLFWSQKQYPEFAVQARNISLETLDRIHRLCRQEQIEFRIATIPFREQVQSPRLFGDEHRIELPQQSVQKFAASNSIPYLDLLPGLSQYAHGHKQDLYYRSDGHLNNDGHRVVGRLLAAFFLAGEGSSPVTAILGARTPPVGRVSSDAVSF